MSEKKEILRLADYEPPQFQIPEVSLEVIIESDELVTVRNKMRVVNIANSKALELLGENQQLHSVSVNGQKLDQSNYQLSDKTLIIENVPDGEFTVELVSTNNPKGNTKLSTNQLNPQT